MSTSSPNYALFEQLALVARSVTALTRLPLAGVGAALLLGFSTTFWAQATTANIRMPAALATAWALERLLAYRASLAQPDPRARGRTLALFASALGLGVSHHGSLIFVAAVLGLYALWLRPAALRRPWPVLTGLLPWLAIPVAAFIGGIGAVSIYRAVYVEKRSLKCACVGGGSNVPLGFVSLTEDLMMVAMAVWMAVAMTG